jgi:hypothetical protein
MAQYIKTYNKGKHLINLDYVKEIFISSTIDSKGKVEKEMVFIDNLGDTILRYKGQTEEYIEEVFQKIEKFIEEKQDTIYNLY